MYRILLKPLSVTCSVCRACSQHQYQTIMRTQFVEQNNTTVLCCLVECNLHQPEQLMYTEVLEWSQK